MNEWLLWWIGFGGLIVLTTLAFHKAMRVRAKPEDRARVVRDFFKAIADEFARSGINLTIEGSSSTLYPSDIWAITATTPPMNWGLVISLACSSKHETISVDFKLDDTAGTPSQLEAKQKVHEIIEPLVTGGVVKLSSNTFVPIPQCGYYLRFAEVVGYAKELVECLLRQKDLYEKMRVATESHTLDLAFYYEHTQDLHVAIASTVKARLMNIAKTKASAQQS